MSVFQADRFYSSEEARSALGLPRTSFFELARDEQLRRFRLGARRVRYAGQDLNELLERAAEPGTRSAS